jgi:chromosomal replication initiator protein
MDTEKLWTTVLAELELTVSRAIFQTAFAKTKLLSLENSVATVGIVNPMMRTMIEGRYYSLIKSVLDHHTKENTSLVFLVITKQEVLTDEQAGPLFSFPEKNTKDTTAMAKRLHLRPDASFDNFAVSTSNQLAYAAATAVARMPGTAYNPLFLYGGVGVGKTHLMHAVANEILKRDSSLRVVYCMGEEFLNEIVEAIQTKTSRQFKQKYRSAQLLLVDDVQFIAGKTTAQEEFFHTFNAVHREGGQVILTSDRPPSEISKLEDRLRSRFEGGLTVDVAPPDFELRIAITNIKALALHLSIPSDAAQVIAGAITDTRAIEGFLRKLMNEIAINKSPITRELVATMLHIKPEEENSAVTTGDATIQKNRRVSAADVLSAVSDFFGVNVKHLKGPQRDRPIARPRQMVMYICKTELNVTLDDIGGLLGGRDHTTVMHGVEKIKQELLEDAKLQEALSGIKERLFS